MAINVTAGTTQVAASQAALQPGIATIPPSVEERIKALEEKLAKLEAVIVVKAAGEVDLNARQLRILGNVWQPLEGKFDIGRLWTEKKNPSVEGHADAIRVLFDHTKLLKKKVLGPGVYSEWTPRPVGWPPE